MVYSPQQKVLGVANKAIYFCFQMLLAPHFIKRPVSSKIKDECLNTVQYYYP